MHHEDLLMAHVTAVSPEGGRAELAGRLFSHPRPDVAEFFALGDQRLQEKLGFVCFFELDAPSCQAGGVGARAGGRVRRQVGVRRAPRARRCARAYGMRS